MLMTLGERRNIMWSFFLKLPFFLTGETTTTVTDALANGFTTVANDALGAIARILPIALPVLGAVVVIMVGIRIFKRVAR